MAYNLDSFFVIWIQNNDIFFRDKTIVLNIFVQINGMAGVLSLAQ